ncbi:exonuclease domain-containing protein [Albimonas sp. CAU 1670]|uniref:exonuclease domain-containing protein n=1 Tax=Albimonas sp. CAU 1670 TaxID=3032599 RepID=UPI0023D9B464|nr:exonuclease domain-containing protein [Albimonas sp. CAU 1670]MDF2231605.1 exonuclease domain-containing protein [Albimonas sp. CAU 1670]
MSLRDRFGRPPPGEAPRRPVPAAAYRFVALDVETACGPVSSICQIGLACVRHDGGIESWSTFVDPGAGVAFTNTWLHGIGRAHVAGAPAFPDALDLLAPLLGRQPLIQHSGFDSRTVAAACALAGREAPAWLWLDSVRIARAAWPEFKGNGGHGLGHLKKALALDFLHHDAEEDARAAAQVVLKAEERLGLPFDAIAPPPKPPRAPRRAARPARADRGPAVLD